MPSFSIRLKELYAMNGSTWAGIGLADYPIYDESHREVLNQKILAHYFNEEIGHETESMFIQSIKARMLIEMPYYNELYETLAKEYDPLTTVDMTVTQESESHSDSVSDSTASTTGESESVVNASAESENSTSSNSSGESQGQLATYPQQMLLSSGEYATSGNTATSESDSTSKASESSDTNSQTNDTSETQSTGNVSAENDATSTSESRQLGRTQSGQSLIQEKLALIMNVDQLVVEMLAECFMGVWTTGDAPFNHNYPPMYNGFPIYGGYTSW